MPPTLPSTLAICLGACLGALGRWWLSRWLNQETAWLPWGTLLANWIGAFLVGCAVVVFDQHSQLDPAWRLAVITGLLGALTTFSSFSVEVVHMLQQGRWPLALSTTALHVLGALALTWLGMRAAAWWLRVGG